jgi:hypothetical protein
MIQLSQILAAINKLDAKLDALATPPVAQHSNAAAPDPASPEAPAYAPSAKDDIDTWYRDLDKAWFYYRAEKDPRLKRQLDAIIKSLETLINAIKNPGSGVVKPK